MIFINIDLNNIRHYDFDDLLFVNVCSIWNIKNSMICQIYHKS